MASKVIHREKLEPPGPIAMPASADPSWDPAWVALAREIETCVLCPLHRTRLHAVVYRGSPTPRFVFVGEAPGAEEDRRGIPFVGRSGQRLNAALSSLDLAADVYGILNLVKCRPPENHFLPAAARTCRPYLDRQLALLRPRALVSLGAHALTALDPTAPRILLAAGHPRRIEGADLFPLIHPAAALRSTTLARRWEEDVRRLGQWLPTLDQPPTREPI